VSISGVDDRRTSAQANADDWIWGTSCRPRLRGVTATSLSDDPEVVDPGSGPFECVRLRSSACLQWQLVLNGSQSSGSVFRGQKQSFMLAW
jgi:hypothetical protein